MSLNEPQQAAVDCRRGPLLVKAGPGSGKTRTVIYRTAALVGADHIDPSRVLLVTFTRKAAKEMRERAGRLVGKAAMRGMWIGTFHSTCARLLRELEDDEHREGRKKDFVIYDSDDQKALVKHAIGSIGLDHKIWSAGETHERISKLKGLGFTPEEVRDLIDGVAARGALNEQLDGEVLDDRQRALVARALAVESVADVEWLHVGLKIWRHYEMQLKQCNSFDFEDLQSVVMRLLESRRPIARALGEKFSHVTVDEYQDTNQVQFRLLRALAQSRNLCVVGDPRQSIYAFRGADIRNILAFKEDYPDATVVDLNINYRSSPQVVRCFNALFSSEPMITPNATGALVRIEMSATEEREADHVVGRIMQHLSEGVAPSEIAVLYRVHALSRPIEERLRNAGVRYQVVGGLSFYERAEVKDVIAYLRLVENPHSNVDLLRVINVPRRAVSDKTIDKLRALAAAEGCSMWSAIPALLSRGDLTQKTHAGVQRFQLAIKQAREDLGGRAIVNDPRQRDLFGEPIGEHPNPTPPSLTTLASTLLDRTGYRGHWQREVQKLEDKGNKPIDHEKAMQKQKNVEEVVNALNAYSDRVRAPTLSGYLEEVALMADQDNLKDGRVSLMTIHAVKGLEFDVVFVVGCEEKLLPFSRATTEADLEEEKRLAFVAISRARKWLTLSLTEQRFMYGDRQEVFASRFLGSLPKDAIDCPRTLRYHAENGARGPGLGTWRI